MEGAEGGRPPDNRLLLASYNIHKCVGTDGRFNPERIARVIEEVNPDIIALQEVDTRFGERRGLLDLAHIRDHTGLEPVPMNGTGPAHGWHGNLILHRRGIVSDIVESHLPGLEPRGALMAEFDLGAAGFLRVIGAHLGLSGRSRQRQAEHIVDLVSGRPAMPTILAGDLNEWRLGRRSALARLRPAFARLPLPVPSFPARLPVFALDRIISDRPDLIATIRLHDSPLARMASDHLPLTAVLALAGD